MFLQFAWTTHLAGMMQVMAEAQALPVKWQDFHPSTALRWIDEGAWRDHVDALSRFTDDDRPLSSDDDIDDTLMRRNLQMLDL